MSLPRRLWRLARHAARAHSDRWTERAPAGGARSEAERELDEFLTGADPTASAAPPPHPYARQYAILGLQSGADLATVQRAWRRLVLQHHPDRHAADPAAQRAASDRLRVINQAHAELIAWLKQNEG